MEIAGVGVKDFCQILGHMLILELPRRVPRPEAEVHCIDDECVGKDLLNIVGVGVNMILGPGLKGNSGLENFTLQVIKEALNVLFIEIN